MAERVVIWKIQQRGWSFEKVWQRHLREWSFGREGSHLKKYGREGGHLKKYSREGGHLIKYGRDICKNTAERVLI